MISFFKENKAFSVIFLIAVVIRFISIAGYQYSYDELSALSRTTYANWHDLVLYGAQIDAHPILIQCFLYALVKVFGYSEVWIKMPFIIMSLGAIIYSYKFALNWFGKLPALLSASIFSFSFIFLYYSPLARMYASGLFFTTALTYYWFNIFFSDTFNKKDFIFMTLFFLLSALNSHISCLYALTLGLAGLFFIKKKILIPYLGSCIAAVVLYLPHLPITFFQLDYGGIGAEQNGWLPPPEKGAFIEFIKVVMGTGYVWIAFVILIFESIFSYGFKSINRKVVLLLTMFFLNYFIIYFYSVLKAPVFQYSVMLFAAPCLVWGICGLIKFNERFGLGIIAMVSVLLLFQSFYRKEFLVSAVLNQNETQYKTLKKTVEKYGKDKVEAVFFDTEKYFVMHYELRDKKKLSYHLGTEPLIADAGWFKSFIQSSKADYIVLGNAFPSQIKMVQEYFPYEVDFLDAANVNCITLSKKPTGRNDESYFSVLNSSDFFQQKDYTYSLDANKLKANSNSFVYPVDSLNEYPFGVDALIKNVSSNTGQIILAQIKVSSVEPLIGVNFNSCVKDKNDSIIYFGGPSMGGFFTENKPYTVYSEVFLGTGLKKWADEDCKMVFFVWNQGQKNFTIEDIKIETLDYRPKRWNLWN